MIGRLRNAWASTDGDRDDIFRSAADELERLRQSSRLFRAEIAELRPKLALALVQRDAARLEVCLLRASAGVVSASTDAEMEAYAKSRGWDLTDARTETRTDGAKRAETDTDDGA